MPLDVELKAIVRDLEFTLTVARKLAGSQGKVLHQEDTFFDSPVCKLKLRIDSEGSVLIAYDRVDQFGLKTSDYERYPVRDSSKLLDVLIKAIGVRGVVKKTRELFILEYQGLTTRIHVDSVQNLGNYIEFEVLVSEESQIPLAKEAIQYLRKQFQLVDTDLVSGGYIDLILNKT